MKSPRNSRHSNERSQPGGVSPLLAAALFAFTLEVAVGCAPQDNGGSTGVGTGGNSTGGASATGGTTVASGTGGASANGTGGVSIPGTGGVTDTGTGGAGLTGTGGGASDGGMPSADGAGPGTGGASSGSGGGTSTDGGGGSGGSTGAAGRAGTGTGGNLGGGGSTATGGSTGAAYNPCPPKGTVCRIEPTGDSITEGFRSSDYGGYREPLFHLALQDKKSITFVGSAPVRGPATVDGVAFPTANEGIGGRRISSISQIIPTTITTNKPNIMLLQIGTNDFSSGAASMTSQLTALVDKILNADPNLLLVLAQLTPTKTDATNNGVEKTYNASMPALVKQRADAGKHIILVDMYDAFVANSNFKTALMSDDLHPKDAGYSVMANVWYAAIKGFLP